MQTSPFIVGVDYKAIFLSPQTEREQDDIEHDDIEGAPSTTRRTSSRLNPKRQASQSVYTYDGDSYLPPIFDSEITELEPNLPLLAFFEDDPEDSSPSTTTLSMNSKDQGDFQLFKPSTSADACSYDLRDTQEPPTVSKEYPNYGSSRDINTSSSDLYDVDTKKDIKSQLEAEPGPVCFPSVSPTPDSPSRLNTELHFHHHSEADSSSSTKKPASSATSSPKDVKPTLPASLTINPTISNKKSSTASAKKGPASNSSSTGSSTSGIPVDPQLAGSSNSNTMQQPQSAATNYFDVSGMSNINSNGSNNSARPMARAGQPSFLKDMGDGMIRTPGPGQMVSPKETFMDFTSILQNAANNSNNKSNSLQQQQQQQLGAGTSDQAAQSLMAALGQAHQQHQLQQQLQQQQLNNQNSAQQQQQRPQVAYPFPNNFQVKPEALNTDIAVPSSSSTSNTNGSNPLPPLPTNYQPPPAPLNFQDGSFFSHQAILASLAAEDNARLVAAMGQGNFGGFNTASYIPTFPSTSTSGDVSVAQHFNQQQPSTSTLSSNNNTSDGSRKRGRGQNSKGKQQQQQHQDSQKQGLTRENSGSQQPPSSVRSTYDMDGDEHNPFHTDASAFFNLDGNDLGLDLSAANSYNEQMQAAGIPIPQSSRTSRASKKKAQQGADMGDFPVAGNSNNNTTGATRFGAAEEDPLHDSSFSTEEDDEWVAEDSDDSFGKPAKKKGKKSGAAGTPSTANTSNTKQTKTKKQSKKDNNNNNVSTSNISSSTATAVPPLPPSSYSGFTFPPQFGADGMFIMPAATDQTPLQSPQQPSTKSENGTSERNKPAAPGTGSIVCDYVDPATGSVCQVRFRRPYDQARHLETVHGVGNDNKPKSVCYTCKKSFSRKDALIRHGRISGHVTFLPAPPPREDWEQQS